MNEPELFGPIEDETLLGEGAVVLRGFAAAESADLATIIAAVAAAAPFRRMVTPGGFRMSVAMTNCGSYGWVLRYLHPLPHQQLSWQLEPEPLR